jgi:hypothetical protein
MASSAHVQGLAHAGALTIGSLAGLLARRVEKDG